jgi:hypothetical protein
MGGSKFTPEQDLRYKNLKTEIQKPVEEPKFAESFLGAAAEMAPIMLHAVMEGQKYGITAATGGAILGAMAGPASPITAPAAAAMMYKVGTT